MKFSDVIGNANVVKAFTGMVDSGRVPHAILLHENDGGGAMRAALSFLQYLYCDDRHDSDSCDACPSCNKLKKLIHPDIHFIFPVTTGTLSINYIQQWRELVKTNPDFTESELDDALGIEKKASIIAVAEAKALLDTLSMSSLEGGYNTVLVYLPEKMNQETANRLLKIIEEPPVKTLFILITHSPEKVLKTISSRCLSIRIQPPVFEQKLSFDNPQLLDELMDRLLERNLFEALSVGEDLSSLPGKDSMKAFIRFFSEYCRQMFLLRQNVKLDGNTDLEEIAKLQRRACAAKPTFPRNALAALDKASLYIDRNVNPKIVFTDLVNRLYLSI